MQTAQADGFASAQALQSARAEVAELRARHPNPGGSYSQPGSSVTASQLAAERCTVQRYRVSVAGLSIRVEKLLNWAKLHVVETEGTLYTAVEEVFETH